MIVERAGRFSMIIVESSSEKSFSMSSTLFKTVFAGAVATGALLLPVSAAQAADKHHPCDGPGFGGHGLFSDDFGFRNDGIGFWNDGFSPWDRGIGFRHHPRHHDTTVIVVTVPQKHQKHHHKPSTPAAPTGNAAGAGYSKPGAAAAGNGGYRKGA
jgi:hypothetical protein